MRSLRSLLVGAVLPFAVLAAHTAGFAQDLSDAVAEHYQTELKSLFEHFHRNPELSFLEHRTAARLAENCASPGRSHGGGSAAPGSSA